MTPTATTPRERAKEERMPRTDAELVAEVYRRMGETVTPLVSPAAPVVYLTDQTGVCKYIMRDPLGNDADAMALLHWCAAPPRGWDWVLEVTDKGESYCGTWKCGGVTVPGTDPAAVRRAICLAMARALGVAGVE